MKFITATMLLTMAVPPTASGQVLEADSLALVDFYFNLDGGGWTNDEHWLQGPVRTWNGITAEGNRVVEINLIRNNLSGQIPSSIGNLTGLKILRAPGNELSGSIPDQIGSLRDLTRLDLADNSLSGTIPASVGQLKKVTWLNLTRNVLEGYIPLELWTMEGLQKLDLGLNNLTGAIPEDIGKLTELRSIELLLNQLSGPLPEALFGLDFVESVFLSYNQFSGSLASSKLTWPLLEYLDLSYTSISGPLPAWLGDRQRLDDLRVSGSPFAGLIPMSFTNLSLNSFYFDETSLCEPNNPEFITWISSVSFVRSSGCKATGLELSESITGLQVYPNPANSYVTFELPRAADRREIEIVDSIGRKMALIPSPSSGFGRSIYFDVTTLSPGVYFARVAHRGELRQIKFVVLR